MLFEELRLAVWDALFACPRCATDYLSCSMSSSLCDVFGLLISHNSLTSTKELFSDLQLNADTCKQLGVHNALLPTGSMCLFCMWHNSEMLCAY